MLTAYEMNCLFAALRVCQSVNYDMLSRKHQEFKQYSNELRSCITLMETELARRLFQRSQLFPTVCYECFIIEQMRFGKQKIFSVLLAQKVTKLRTLTGVTRHVSCMFLLNSDQEQ